MAACAATACTHDCSLGSPCRKRFALPALRTGPGIRFPLPHPSGWAEERSKKWIRASDCLSRRRVRARPHFLRAPQVAPKRSAGDPDHRVAFSLVTFFWRSKRKLLAAGQPPANRGASTACRRSSQRWIPDQVRDDIPGNQPPVTSNRAVNSPRFNSPSTSPSRCCACRVLTAFGVTGRLAMMSSFFIECSQPTSSVTVTW